MRTLRHAGSSGLCLCLLAFALLLRVGVPAGWMPAEQQIGIRLCSGSAADAGRASLQATSAFLQAAGEQAAGEQAAGEQAGGHHPNSQPDGQDHRPCAFTTLAMAADMPTSPLLVPPADFAETARSTAPKPTAPRASSALPPPSTGPPLSA